MTQQVINIGSTPNDGTGDQLRTAFDKSNDNFAELYAAVPTLQPLDADLTSIASYGGTDTWLYRSAADTWSEVTVGTGLTFTSGILDAPVFTSSAKGEVPASGGGTTTFLRADGTWATPGGVGGGDVVAASNNTFTGSNFFNGANTVFGHSAIVTTAAFKVQTANTQVAITNFAASASGNFINFQKSRNATLGSHTIVQNNDILGGFQFQGSDGSAFFTSSLVRGAVDGTPAAGDVPGRLEFLTKAAGTAVAVRMTIASSGDVSLAASPVAGDSSTKVATTAFVQAAIATSSAVGTPSAPQGRLTLFGGTPVLTNSVAGATTLVYTPYVGNKVPIYDGTSMVMTTFVELSAVTTDTTKSPAAIGASKVNDWFIWNDAGTIRLGHGPDWTNDTTRSAGTALTRVNGIWLNNAAITNGPAAQRGTYVGTTRSNASSQLDWIIGGIAAGGTAAFFGVWNAYNRVDVRTMVRDTTDSWSTGTTIRPANNSITMRISFVMGLAEDACFADFSASGLVTAGYLNIGVGVDVTNAFSGRTGYSQGTVSLPSYGSYSDTFLGFHFFQAMEAYTGGGTGTFFGDASVPNNVQNGFAAHLRM